MEDEPVYQALVQCSTCGTPVLFKRIELGYKACEHCGKLIASPNKTNLDDYYSYD